MINLLIASEYIEFYLYKGTYLIPIYFYLFEDSKYINAMDVIACLGYMNPEKQWEITKSKLGRLLGVIECTLSSMCQIDSDSSIMVTEDYLTYQQVELVIESTTKIGKREKSRLLNFIRNSI
jgi:hypothetical protein